MMLREMWRRRELWDWMLGTAAASVCAAAVAIAWAIAQPEPPMGQLVFNARAATCGGAVCDGTCIEMGGVGPTCLHDTPAYLAIEDNLEGLRDILVVCTGPAVRPTRCWAAPGVVMTQQPWWLDDAYVPPERE